MPCKHGGLQAELARACAVFQIPLTKLLRGSLLAHLPQLG